MKRSVTKLFLAAAGILGCASGVSADSGQWRTHSTFDDDVSHIFVGKDRVYFLGLAQPYNPNRLMNARRQYFLYCYDKEADEMINYTSDNYLTRTVINAAEYNPAKGYLLLVYDDYDIDLIFDDGTRKNIPSYKSVTMTLSKDVNSVTFDNERDLAYLATDFGYIAINDEKGEIAESRNYGQQLQSVGRVGDRFLLLTSDSLLEGEASAPRLGFSDYKTVGPIAGGHRILPLNDTYCVAVGGGGKASGTLYRVNVSGGTTTLNFWRDAKIVNIEKSTDGYTLGIETNLLFLHGDGTHDSLESQREDWQQASATSDMKEIWYGAPRKGLRSKSYDRSGPTWSVTRDFMRPNAAAPFLVDNMVYTSDRGMMLVNHSSSHPFFSSNEPAPVVISTWKDGEWSEYGPAYTNPVQTPVLSDPNGLEIDPDNGNLVYFGSYTDGILRLDLADPENVLHISRPGDPCSHLPGFVSMVPDQLNVGYDRMCHFSAPMFDADGFLWSSYNDRAAQSGREHLTLYYWTPEDRKASTGAASFRPWKVLEVDGLSPSNTDLLVPLKLTRNILVYAKNQGSGPVVVIDHGGTPDDPSDDRIVKINKTLDGEGNRINIHSVNAVFEDPATGFVWIGHDTGVFYFSPKNIFENPDDISLAKVARNDGTNLADYLLAEVTVYDITADSSGRKWFSTGGGGLVCTSGDGTSIISEYTKGNSRLPDNVVYASRYNPQSNSMMISTAAGLVELYISGIASGEDDMNFARVYPNPVRPDYYGYVTIDGLADNALVKIVDASGNLVRELERASGGSTRWDTTNFNHNKVASGVYYVLASAGSDSSSMAKVARLLVVR